MDLICGINPVLEALASGTRHFDRLLVVKGMRNRRIAEVTARGSKLGIPMRFEAREALDRMAAGVPHQGIIAVVSSRPLATLEEILGSLTDPGLLVLLDGVEDPRNLGAILRTCEGAGAQGVLLPERHSAGLSETVARTSAGAVEHIRVARIGNVAQAIDALKEKGLWIVGFDAHGTERWDRVDLQKPVVLVFGGESRGIRRLVREKCDHVASLPLCGHVASLNVSVVAGIALYEAIRQRKSIPSPVKPIPVGSPAPGRIVGPSARDLEDERDLLREPESGDGMEDEDLPEPVVRLDDDESVAWALKPAPAPDASPAWNERRRLIPAGAGRDRSGPPDRGRGRRRKRGRPGGQGGRGPQHGPQEAGAPPPPTAAPSGEAPQGGQAPSGRRRRRRRRRGPPA